MSKNLRDDILNACRGYERHYIIETLKYILDDNTPKTLRELYNMKTCPNCGSPEVHITDVMNGVCEGRPHVIAKMGFCTACKFHSKKVYKRELKEPITDAIWTKKTVQVWNNTHTTSVFKITEELYGTPYQFFLNAEEVLELIEALTRYGKLTSRSQRYDRPVDSQSIVSEMADVIICIYQLLHTKRISPDVLNSVIKDKLDRLCAHESVRTAALKLSSNVNQETFVSVHIAADPDSINNREHD